MASEASVDDINRFLPGPIQSLCEICDHRKTAAERWGGGPVVSKQIGDVSGGWTPGCVQAAWLGIKSPNPAG